MIHNSQIKTDHDVLRGKTASVVDTLGKGVPIKNMKPYINFVDKFIKSAEIINGEALLPTEGRPVVAIVSHGPGFSWLPLPALAGKTFMENGYEDSVFGMFPHKAMFLIPGLKNYYKKILGAPTDIETVDDIVNVLKNNEIGLTGTAPEGANCLLSYDEYVAPFRSKGLIAAAIKADADICLLAHQGAEEWNKAVNLPFKWTMPFTNGLRGINITLPPYKKIENYIALCKRYKPLITSKDLIGKTKREERMLLHLEVEKIRGELNLMTDDLKIKLTEKKLQNNDRKKKAQSDKGQIIRLKKEAQSGSNDVVKKKINKSETAQIISIKESTKSGLAYNMNKKLTKEVNGIIKGRAEKWSLEDQNLETVEKQNKLRDFFLDKYFRLEMTGWDRLPNRASMIVGIHSGTWLTMDAWTLCGEWQRRLKSQRILHGTAHDALMAMPGIGQYFRNVGVIPAKRESVSAAFAAGHDVALWPGGEIDAMRAWSRRNIVDLGGRKGFIRQAIRSGVPIVPIATVGGHDTVFVLSENRRLAKMLGLKKLLRSEIFPLVLGLPFGIWLEALPTHIPLPAKIRTEFLDPIEIDSDPERENDEEYVDKKYEEVRCAIQKGVDRLSGLRKFPIFG